MWLFGLADEYVPPLLAVAAVLMVGLVPSDIALGGFSSRTLTTLIGVYAQASLIAWRCPRSTSRRPGSTATITPER
jgi:divalent anion:Na+ symporter, DASS family